MLLKKGHSRYPIGHVVRLQASKQVEAEDGTFNEVKTQGPNRKVKVSQQP